VAAGARLQDPKHALPQIMRHLKAKPRHAMRQSVRIAVVSPLSRAPYEIRAQYIYVRADGSRALDTLLADATVRVP